jgi:hypothetical protein
MRPASNLLFNNFNTYEWLDYQLSSGFSGRLKEKKYYVSNLNLSKSNINASGDDFDNVAGKGKLCKGAGLSGAEKRACKKNIKTSCGRKPMFGRAKKEKWATCASANIVTPEQSAQETADKLVPTKEEGGLSTGAKVMIAVGTIGFLAFVGFAVASKKKAQPAMMKQSPAMARG